MARTKQPPTIGTLQKQYEYHNNYRDKNYDRIELIVPKGRKDLIKEHAKELGVSVADYINKLIEKDMGLSE